MLLTLATGSLCNRITLNGEHPITMFDLPAYAIDHLQLRGLNVKSSMLAGWSMQDLDRLRDRADKAACPCLVLVEDTPLPFGDPREKRQAEIADRVERLAVAANRLGCNALAMSIDAPNDDEAFETVAASAKALMPTIERLELNLLLAPNVGLTNDPDRLTDLIKRIGGFRIGSLPSFGHAASLGDPVEPLRKLAPYAGAIHATVTGFTRAGRHKQFDLEVCVKAIRSVGFINTLAIEYEGDGDPVESIERARVMLQAAIDAEDA